MNRYRKALRIIGVVLAVYAVLVATHRGEFWPFSIYPMFSQAGSPWTRSLVRQMPSDEVPSWEAMSLQDLPGEAFPLKSRGINQNDIANYISKTEQWTPNRLRGLRSVFQGGYDFSEPLLVMRVRGRLVADSVAVTATPLILYTSRGARVHPSLETASDSTPPLPRSPTTGTAR